MSNVCYQKSNTMLRLFELLNLRVFRNFKYLYRQTIKFTWIWLNHKRGTPIHRVIADSLINILHFY